jgi:hypothetical protein
LGALVRAAGGLRGTALLFAAAGISLLVTTATNLVQP